MVMTATKLEAAYDKAQWDFTAFKRILYKRYENPPHMALIDRALTQCLKYIETGGKSGISRLIIEVPPRFGKTLTVSRLFPAWALGRNPDIRVMLVSYGASLAHKNSRLARNFIKSPYYSAIFPDVSLADDSASVSEWNMKGTEGGCDALGLEGSATGKGAHILVLDDLVKNRAEAESELMRNKTWDAFTGDLYNRLEPNGVIIMMFCMTGDTPVMMSDGTERPLSEIKIGDHIATYDNGKLGVSKVLNHKNNGHDAIYKIMMTSGIIVRANERHPFLVEEHGELKWIQLKNLSTGQKIVTVKGNGANGKIKPVLPMGAMNPLSVEGIACLTTTKKCGLTDIAHLITKKTAQTLALNIATELHPLSTMQSLHRKAVNALFAGSCQTLTLNSIKMEDYVLTTAMTQEKSEGFYATPVISQLDTLNQKQTLLPCWNTSDFTTDEIVSIEPDGNEDVFDIQVERTENFIANGLVSHNTRWHTDDPVGRALQMEDEQWTRIKLPAFAEGHDPLGRELGKSLWPERYNEETLAKIQSAIGEYNFASQYQQRPMPSKAGLFDTSKIKIIDYIPPNLEKVRFYDLAVTAKKHSDYTVGLLLGIDKQENIYILHVYRVQKTPVYVEADIISNALMDGRGVRIRLEAEKAGIVQLDYLLTKSELRGYQLDAKAPEGDKYTRAQPIASRVNAEKVFMVKGEWNRVTLDELAVFPMGAHDDIVDALSGAYDAVANNQFMREVAMPDWYFNTDGNWT